MTLIDDFLNDPGTYEKPAQQVNPRRKLDQLPREADPISPFGEQEEIPTETPMDWYFGYSQTRRFRASERRARDLTADRASRILRAQVLTGQPGDLIDDNLDDIEAQIQSSEFDAEEFRKFSPIVADWYAENPNRIAVARTDFSKMGLVEQMFRSISLGYRHGRETNELGRAAYDFGFGDRNPKIRGEIEHLDRSLKATPSGESFAAGWLYDAGTLLGQLFDSVWWSGDRTLQGGVAGVTAAAVAGQAGPQALLPEEIVTVPVGFLTGAGVGLATGLAEQAYVIEAGHAYLEMDRLTSIDGEVIDDRTKQATAAFVGVVNASLELVGLKIASVPLRKLGRKLVTNPVIAQVKKQTIKTAALEFGKNWSMVVGGEVVTEVMQEGMNIIGEEAAAMIQGGRFENRDDVARLMTIAGKVFRGMSLLALPGATANFVVDARRAIRNEQAYNAISETLRDAEIQKRVPEDVKGVIKKVATETGEFVYMNARELRDIWQSRVDARGKPLNAMDEFERIGGSRREFARALRQEDGHVAIPTEVFAVEMLATPDGDTHAQSAKPDPSDMTAKEARERIQQLQERAEEGQEVSREEKVKQARQKLREVAQEGAPDPRALADVSELIGPESVSERTAKASKEEATEAVQVEEPSEEEASAQEVVDRVQGGLERAGFDPVAIGPLLQAVRARSITRAERRGLGETPFELFRRHGLDFFLEELDVLREARGQVFEQGPVRLGNAASKALEDAKGNPNKALRSLQKQAKKETDVESKKVLNDAVKELRQFRRRGITKKPRGGISFADRSNVIVAFTKSRDVTTVIHELFGHLWLEELIEDAFTAGTPDQLRTDLDDLLEWMGVKARSKDGEAAVREAITHKDHEQAARGIEAYFREGKAPSAKLQPILRRIKDWMLEIYKSITQLDVTLSDPVRRVFDRMLASDEEIQNALAEQNEFAISAKELKRAGLPDKEAESIAKADRDAADKASEDLTRKLLEQEEFGTRKAIREERKAVTEIEQDRLNSDPAFVALHVLARGKMPDGTDPELPTGRQPSNLSRRAVLEEFGPERLEDLPRAIFARKDLDGLAADQAAEDFEEFENGAALLDAIARLFEEEVQSSPLLREEKDLDSQIDALRREQFHLVGQAKASKVQVRDANAALRVRLADALKRQEEESIAETKEILDDIQKRGKIRPVIKGEIPPKGYQAKAGKGVPSDKMAQELFDRGLIGEASVSDLYEWVSDADSRVKKSDQRIKKEIPKDAVDVANRSGEDSIKALIGNIRQQSILSKQLRRVRRDARAVQSDFERTLRVDNILRARVDEAMRMRHPTIEEDFRLTDESYDSVFNDERANTLRRKAQFFASENFAKLKNLRRRVNGGRIVTEDALKAEAREIINAQKILSVNPAEHRSNVARQARKAHLAIEKADWKGLLDALERQRFSHALFREATEVRKGVQRRVKKAKRFNQRSVREGLGKVTTRVEDPQTGKEITVFSYRDPIDKIMESYDFNAASLKTIEKRESLVQFMERVEEEENMVPAIPKWIVDEARKTHYKNLTFNEFVEVTDALESIAHQAKLKGKLLRKERERNLESIADEAEIRAGEFAKPRPEPLVEKDREQLKAKRIAGELIIMQRKTASLAREMDGGKDGGFFWQTLILPKNIAQDREAAVNLESQKRLQKLQRIYTWKERRKWHDLHFIEELGTSLSKEGEIVVGLNWGNPEGRQRVMSTFNIILKRERGNEITEADIQPILNRLDEKDKRYIEGTWKHWAEFWPDIRALSDKVDGVPVDQVESLPFETTIGEWAGGYHPLVYDTRQLESTNKKSKRAQLEELEEIAIRAMGGFAHRQMVRSNHRRNRDKFVDKALLFSLSVVPNATKQIIHDLTHYEYFIDTTRILEHPRVANAVRENYGDLVLAQFKTELRFLAAGGNPARNAIERGLRWLRTGASMAALAFKASVVMVQPLGITQSIQRLGETTGSKARAAQAVARATQRFYSHPDGIAEMVQWIQDNSDLMRTRMRTQDRELNELQNVVSPTLGVISRVQAWGMYAVAKSQGVVDNITWLAAYDVFAEMEGLEKAEDLVKHGQVNERIARLADQTVRDTQGSGLLGDLSQFQRDSEYTKVFSLFSTFFNARYNMFVESMKQAGRDPTVFGSAQRIAADYLLMYAVPTAIMFTVTEWLRGRRDEDDDGYWLDLLLTFAQEPLGDIFVLREITGSLGYKYTGPAGFRIFGELHDTANKFLHADFDAGFWRKLNSSSGIILHYPASQVDASARGFFAWLDGEAPATSIVFGPPRRSRF